jgi:hypothetical protein
MMEIILGVAIGISITFLLIYLYIRGLVREVMQEIDGHVEKVKTKLLPVVVEKEGEQIYCYSQDGHQFICQGTTLDEIRTAMKKRFPDRVAFLAGGDADLVEQLRKELKVE